MSLGYSFPGLGHAGVGRGIVSFGLMGGAEVEEPYYRIVVCLDGSVRVSVSESGGLMVETALAGALRVGAETSGSAREDVLPALSGPVLTGPALTGTVLAQCPSL